MQTTPLLILAMLYICERIYAFEFDSENTMNNFFDGDPKNIESGRFESEFQRRTSEDAAPSFLGGSGGSNPTRRLIQPPPLKRSMELSIQQRSNNNAYSSSGQSSFPRRLIQPPPLKRSADYNGVYRWLSRQAYEPYPVEY